MRNNIRNNKVRLKLPRQGFKRQWLRCKQHGRVYFYDYQPYSLSNPILTSDCGCDPRGMSYVSDEDGITAWLADRHKEMEHGGTDTG